MSLDHPAHQGQADALPLRHVGVEPVEGGEDALVIGLGNTQTVVLDVIDVEARGRFPRARGSVHPYFNRTGPAPSR